MDINFFRDLIDKYLSQFSFFGNLEYYQSVAQKYFSIEGVISAVVLGFLILIMLYNEDNKKAAPVKALMGLVAVETSPVLLGMVYSVFGLYYNNSGIVYYDAIGSGIFNMGMNPVNNIISGFVLVLVMYSVYKFDEGFAFWVGILFYLITLLMNVNYYVPYLGHGEVLFAFVQYLVGAVVMGFLSASFCSKKYFYNAWIIYIVYHIVSRIIVALTYGCLVQKLSFADCIREYVMFLPSQTKNILIDVFIFGFILMIAIIYERTVFKDIKAKRVPPPTSDE